MALLQHANGSSACAKWPCAWPKGNTPRSCSCRRTQGADVGMLLTYLRCSRTSPAPRSPSWAHQPAQGKIPVSGKGFFTDPKDPKDPQTLDPSTTAPPWFGSSSSVHGEGQPVCQGHAEGALHLLDIRVRGQVELHEARAGLRQQHHARSRNLSRRAPARQLPLRRCWHRRGCQDCQQQGLRPHPWQQARPPPPPLQQH